MRWFRRVRREPPPDPGSPHEFRQIDDDGIGALAAGGAYGGAGDFGGLSQLTTTDNFIRKSRCGIPGCGRERSDPMHQGR